MKKRDFLRRLLNVVPAVVIGKNLPVLDEPVKKVELQPENKVVGVPDNHQCSSGFVYLWNSDEGKTEFLTSKEHHSKWLKRELAKRKYKDKKFGNG